MRAAVIFDFDGVLIDSEPLQYQAYSQVLARFSVSVSPEEYGVHWIGQGRGPEYAVETYDLPVAPDELRALKEPVYQAILREGVSLMPGVVEALTRLNGRFTLGVATNSRRRDVSLAMDNLGLARFFSAVVTREDYQLAKPNPDAFLTAAERLSVPPQRCVVVEDAYKGVLAAHRAGALAVAVPHSFTQENDFSLAAAVLHSLDELTVALVEQLLAGRNGQ